MLFFQFCDEVVILLVQVFGQKGWLGGEVSLLIYMFGEMYMVLVMNLGVEQVVKLGLMVIGQCWWVCLFVGVLVVLGDCLWFWGWEWKVVLVEVWISYIKVIVEEIC